MRGLALVVLVLLSQLPAMAQDAGSARARPAPRWSDGTVNLGAPPGEIDTCDGAEPLTTIPENYETVTGLRERSGLVHIDRVPMQQWARAIVTLRHERFLADEPYEVRSSSIVP